MANNQVVISRIQHRRGLKENLPQPLLPGELALTLDTGELWIGGDPNQPPYGVRVYNLTDQSTAEGIVDNNIADITVDVSFSQSDFDVLVDYLTTSPVPAVTLEEKDIYWDGGEIIFIAADPTVDPDNTIANILLAMQDVSNPVNSKYVSGQALGARSVPNAFDVNGFFNLSNGAQGRAAAKLINRINGSSIATTSTNIQVPTTGASVGQALYRDFTVTDTDVGFTWSATGTLSADSTVDELTFVSGIGIDIDIDPASDAIRITAAGSANSYSNLTDGTNTSTAVGADTFKLRTANNRLSIVVANDDPTHGDNALFTLEEANIDHNALANFVGNEHIDHSAVTLTAGSGLSGGGDITTSRTFDINVSNSIEVSTDNLQLVGDSLAPGNNFYYGTDGTGTKGFFSLPSANQFSTITITDTDSGYTWGATGSISADSPADTLTIVSGVGVDVDVDTASDAIRVTATGSVTAFNDLTDVDLTGAADNDLLYRSGSNWVDTGGTLTFDGAKLTTVASATGSAGLNLPHGVAPTTPADGDLWTTTSSVFARINGSTIDLGAGGGSSNSFETQTVTDTDSGFTWSATGSVVADSSTDTLTWVSGAGINIDVDPASDAIRITATAAAPALNDLTDVDTTGVGTGDLLYKSAGDWLDTAGGLTWDGTTTLKVTSLTDAILTLEADTNNSGENDNAYIIYSQDGGVATGLMGLTGDLNLQPDGTVTSNIPVNSLLIMNQLDSGGGAGSTEAAVVIGAHNTVKLLIDNDKTQSFQRLVLPASGTLAQLNLPHGTTPSIFSNGDFWTTTSGVFARVNGATRQLDLDPANSTLNSLSDVDTTGVATGSLLYKSAGDWVDSGGDLLYDGTTLSILNLTSVDNTQAIAIGEDATPAFAIFYDGAGAGATGNSLRLGSPTGGWEPDGISIRGDGQVTISAGGHTFTSALYVAPASTTSSASFRIPHGVAPTTPVDGDIWTTVTSVFARVNGTTVDLGTGGGTSNSFETQTITDTDSGFTWSATGSAVADSGTDTLTWVSGVGIDIDVDPASDAIRITATGPTTLDGLTDVDLTGAADNDLLYRSGGNWIDTGGTLTFDGSKLTTVASATGSAGFNLPHGVAPTAPVDGDLWTTTTSVFARINGATVDLAAGGGSSNSFATQTVTDTDSGFTWSATGSAVADSSSDTLTWVSGAGINIDVDPASDAIRITATGTTPALNDLTDVDTTGVTTGDLLYKSAGDWIDTDGALSWNANRLLINANPAELHLQDVTLGGISVWKLRSSADIFSIRDNNDVDLLQFKDFQNSATIVNQRETLVDDFDLNRNLFTLTANTAVFTDTGLQWTAGGAGVKVNVIFIDYSLYGIDTGDEWVATGTFKIAAIPFAGAANSSDDRIEARDVGFVGDVTFQVTHTGDPSVIKLQYTNSASVNVTLKVSVVRKWYSV